MKKELDTQPLTMTDATHPSMVHSEQTPTIPTKHQSGLKQIIKDIRPQQNNHITVHNLAITKMAERLKDLKSFRRLNPITCTAIEIKMNS